MSPDREALLRLVEDLPETEVSVVLAEVRAHVPGAAESTWPPSWFASVGGTVPVTAARADDLLAEGFGR